MNRAEAAAIVEVALQFAARVDESIRALMRTSPATAQLNEYRRAAGQVLGELYTEILLPIFAEYPELEPDAIKGEGTGVASPMDPVVAEQITSVMDDLSAWVAQLPSSRNVISAVENVRAFVAKARG